MDLLRVVATVMIRTGEYSYTYILVRYLSNLRPLCTRKYTGVKVLVRRRVHQYSAVHMYNRIDRKFSMVCFLAYGDTTLYVVYFNQPELPVVMFKALRTLCRIILRDVVYIYAYTVCT